MIIRTKEPKDPEGILVDEMKDGVIYTLAAKKAYNYLVIKTGRNFIIISDSPSDRSISVACSSVHIPQRFIPYQGTLLLSNNTEEA